MTTLTPSKRAARYNSASEAIMSSSPGRPSLLVMPPEVAIKIFCQLPSFSDIFALSAVCSWFRHLWLKNVNHIYNQIAPINIPCELVARRFLVDQGGPSMGSPMSAKDIIQMVRNASLIESAILQFEKEIVWRVRLDVPYDQKFYGGDLSKHPPNLTRTERTRFIRTYYSLWSMLRLDPSEWDSRLQAMTTQELYYLREMSNLNQSVGKEETIPPSRYPHLPSDSVHYIMDFTPSEKRSALERTIWEQIVRNTWRFFKRDAEDPCLYAKHEGFLNFVVLWDHWQPSLKDLVCHDSRSLVKVSLAVQEQYLWREGLDESF